MWPAAPKANGRLAGSAWSRPGSFGSASPGASSPREPKGIRERAMLVNVGWVAGAAMATRTSTVWRVWVRPVSSISFSTQPRSRPRSPSGPRSSVYQRPLGSGPQQVPTGRQGS